MWKIAWKSWSREEEMEGSEGAEKRLSSRLATASRTRCMEGKIQR
jgi:hypothetical protein